MSGCYRQGIDGKGEWKRRAEGSYISLRVLTHAGGGLSLSLDFPPHILDSAYSVPRVPPSYFFTAFKCGKNSPMFLNPSRAGGPPAQPRRVSPTSTKFRA